MQIVLSLRCGGITWSCKSQIRQFGCSLLQRQAAKAKATQDNKVKATKDNIKSERREGKKGPPELVRPGELPQDLRVWQNACVCIDKPVNWTSMDVCAKLRGTVKVKKVGHAGTLDPLATGLLIILTGSGTKQVDKYMAMTKRYTGQFCLGEGTPSYDAGTEVNEKLPWEHITDEQIQQILPQFIGDIKQIPPMYSAIKVKGKRLYELARKGITENALPPRDVTVEQFTVKQLEGQIYQYDVTCSKGTYIRSLMHDFGRSLGSIAYVTELRRESIGSFNVQNAWKLEELVDEIQELRNSKRVQ
eukprot:TRINITY_DN14910_c0_g2_i2.p1 TRINITY_DN14910_c0_g2~~TRINITY_DN14910_c0_g2_i2.p1  ORF type:complete len:303 (-),score=26.86 TRINITY_DN14910_c0_g2_i2:400-1308(-)